MLSVMGAEARYSEAVIPAFKDMACRLALVLALAPSGHVAGVEPDLGADRIDRTVQAVPTCSTNGSERWPLK